MEYWAFTIALGWMRLRRMLGGMMDFEFSMRRYVFLKAQKTSFQRSRNHRKQIWANDLELRRKPHHWVYLEKPRDFHVLHFCIRGRTMKLWDPECRKKKINQKKRWRRVPIRAWHVDRWPNQIATHHQRRSRLCWLWGGIERRGEVKWPC